MKTTSRGPAISEEHNNRSGPKMEKGVRCTDVYVPVPFLFLANLSCFLQSHLLFLLQKKIFLSAVAM